MQEDSACIEAGNNDYPTLWITTFVFSSSWTKNQPDVSRLFYIMRPVPPFPRPMPTLLPTARTCGHTNVRIGKIKHIFFTASPVPPGACPMGGCREVEPAVGVRLDRRVEERRGVCAGPVRHDGPTGLERAVTWDCRGASGDGEERGAKGK